MSHYLFKTWGPPYQRLKKTFPETAGSTQTQSKSNIKSTLESLLPNKK
jgi:hypothetical protein